MKHVLADTYLLKILFTGVGMIAVDDNRWVLESSFIVELQKQLKILVVIVWISTTEAVFISAENSVSKRVSLSGYLPVPVYEILLGLGCGD